MSMVRREFIASAIRPFMASTTAFGTISFPSGWARDLANSSANFESSTEIFFSAVENMIGFVRSSKSKSLRHSEMRFCGFEQGDVS